MYVVTFYSFKGGVGRTLALVNVGVELARTGRRVLCVDFDLEAPGLDTFAPLKPRTPCRGVVEYVSDFVVSGQAPDVRDYLYECTGVGQGGGGLFVMPAGDGRSQYAKMLESINWKSLYQDSEGFLMIEDLREQWRVSCDPAYVLVDSRTGHTDVGGICTRQLPDAVVVFFFPNEQNLVGLKPIVDAIRAEEAHQTKNPIEVHFVMSNVPNLDDEDEILANLSNRFRRELGYRSARIIHRYDSLSLLEQSVFVDTHPKSRLAKEYRELLGEITAANPEDKEGAKRFLESLTRPMRVGLSRGENVVRRIGNIVSHHIDDPELLFLSAMGLKRRGQHDKANALVDKAVSLGLRDAGAFVERAEARLRASARNEAVHDVMQALVCERVGPDIVSRGMELLQQCCPERLIEAIETPAVKELGVEEWCGLAGQLDDSRQGMEAVVRLLSPHAGDTELARKQVNEIRHHLSLAYMSLSRFSDVVELYGDDRPEPAKLTIVDAFNYGMAEWGLVGEPHRDMFERVIQDVLTEGVDVSANYCQCLAVAFHICGNDRDALDYVSRAEKIMCERTPWREFSCWRYLSVEMREFSEDCDAIRTYILEGRGAPAMFADTGSA